MKPYFTAEQRQHCLRKLKKGPQFGDADKLRDFTIKVAEQITGKPVRKWAEQRMKEWRKLEANGPISNNHTFLY